MFRLLAENGLDLAEGLLVGFLIHQHLGAGVMDTQPELRLAQTHQLVEFGQGGGEVLADAIHIDRAEGGLELHFRATVFGGIGDLAEPGAGGGQRAFAERERGVGNLEPCLLLGVEGTGRFARPDRQFLDQSLGLGAAVGLDIALQQPEGVFQRQFAQHRLELIGMGKVEIPGAVGVALHEFGVRLVNRERRIGFIHRDLDRADRGGGLAYHQTKSARDLAFQTSAGDGHGHRRLACGERGFGKERQRFNILVVSDRCVPQSCCDGFGGGPFFFLLQFLEHARHQQLATRPPPRNDTERRVLREEGKHELAGRVGPLGQSRNRLQACDRNNIGCCGRALHHGLEGRLDGGGCGVFRQCQQVTADVLGIRRQHGGRHRDPPEKQAVRGHVVVRRIHLFIGR